MPRLYRYKTSAMFRTQSPSRSPTSDPPLQLQGRLPWHRLLDEEGRRPSGRVSFTTKPSPLPTAAATEAAGDDCGRESLAPVVLRRVRTSALKFATPLSLITVNWRVARLNWPEEARVTRPPARTRPLYFLPVEAVRPGQSDPAVTEVSWTRDVSYATPTSTAPTLLSRRMLTGTLNCCPLWTGGTGHPLGAPRSSSLGPGKRLVQN